MNKTQDKLAHGFLYLGFLVGVVSIYFWRFSASVQFVVILSLIAFYLIWGALYHNHKGDLDKRLALEYLLIGAVCLLASVVVFLA